MKLGIVTNFYNPAFGANTYFLAKGLSKLGVEVTLFASSKYGQKKPPPYYEEPSNPLFTLVRIPTSRVVTNVPLFKGLKDYLSQYHFDILQTEDAYQPYSLTVSRYCKVHNIPMVLRHDLSEVPPFPYSVPFKFIEQFVSKPVLRNSKIAICPTQGAKDYLLKFKIPIPIEVIPFGVDTDTIKPLSDKDFRVVAQKDKFILLCIARLVPLKGVSDLIKALPEIKAHIPNVHLILVGKGPLQFELESLAKQLGVFDIITFVGFIPHKRIQDYINICDIFILPSYQEAPGLVVMEAMACEKPVIATNISGINDVIQNGEDGWLIHTKSPDEISSTVISLYDNPYTRSRLSINARKKILSFYSWNEICKQYIYIYSKILG